MRSGSPAVRRATGLVWRRSRGVRAHSSDVAARCGCMCARCDGIAATSRASALCTRERTGTRGDVRVCSRGVSDAARDMSRRARAGEARVRGVAARNGNAAGC